ncbi:hypothetical protein D6C81_02430 [Aureobasidium pullulans]|nr:hypothetical protein D6C81_02430 [Aureobasidium pullulans]
MAAQLTPRKGIECSYDDCFHSFDTDAEMVAHLKNPENHPFYCGKNPGFERIQRGFKKCDFHGKTWDELVAHKVESMLPWLVGDRRNEKPKKLNHIVCEFCGVDFESLSGRDMHRKKMHQAEHHIACKGSLLVRDFEGNTVHEECGSLFGRASQLISHIEGGFCVYIKPMTLRQEREHKHMVKLILDDPEGFKENMITMPYTPLEPPATDSDEMSGGVAVDLLSQSDITQYNGQSPLNPETASSVQDSSGVEWPSLPGPDYGQLKQSMKRFSISPVGSAAPPFGHEESDNDDTISLSSNAATVNSDDEDGPVTPTKPWSTKEEVHKLFEHNKPKVKAITNWTGVNAAHQRSKEEDQDSNIFDTHFWDPHHTDFKPEFFYRPVEDEEQHVHPYQCPFESCKRRFDTPQKIGDHMRESHAAQRNLCPVCCKDFFRLSLLVAHFEASSAGAKCDVARRPGYSVMLFEITGGLIKAEKALEEPIWDHKLASGEPIRPAQEAEIQDKQWVGSGVGVKDYNYRIYPPAAPVWKY